ncbi:MAG: glycerol-3-phosphate 1-O-acyltransferase [Myxococcota bacterium]
MTSALSQALRDEPPWPGTTPRQRILYLLDASSGFERKLLLAWIARNRPEATAVEASPEPETVKLPPSRRRVPVSLEPLEQHLAAGEELLLAPLRVAWIPRKRDGVRSARFSDVLRLGDPRDPGPLRQRAIYRRERDRCRIVAGEPAPASELRQRWRASVGSDLGETTGFAEFVSRQAHLALERAERLLRGARYKVPRLVHEDILARPGFRGGLAQLARSEDIRPKRVRKDAARYLREIAATHSTFVIDLVARLIRLFYTQGYSESIHYDRAKLERIRALAQQHSVVFLPTHKSNLDHLVLQYMLHENGLPPNHTAGGINMNFFPLGPLVRRSGVFFIRRTFKDNEVYKFVLRHYVDYLVEKRFPLEWYIEGGRSRSGKLLPPRFGMLAYVVDAYRRGKSEDVSLIPVSIAYDQISDVQDYAAEQQGAAKQKESFGWMVGWVRRMRRRYGGIHIDFGEPVSLAKALGPADPSRESNPDEKNLELQKLAFEVCVRINGATPITPISLVTLALLGAGGQAQTLAEVSLRLKNLLAAVARRQLPNTGLEELEAPEGLERVLEALAENEVVDRFAEGHECVYRIGSDRELAAAYYRNSIIHFFVNPAIVEVALLDSTEAPDEERVGRFWQTAMDLRDLLKFEFFFAEKDVFRGELRQELASLDPQWEIALEKGVDATQDLVKRSKPFNAHRVLRPFLESYRIVADRLERQEPDEAIDRQAFVSDCLGLGRQYHLQRRIRSAASISQVLFQTALKIAENRGLLGTGDEALARARRDFAEEIRVALRHIDAIDVLAASRRTGLID